MAGLHDSQVQVLGAGQVNGAEVGTHEALMAQGGQYAELYRIQTSMPIDGRTACVIVSTRGVRSRIGFWAGYADGGCTWS